MTFSVYTLSDPRTGHVRYVGFTSVSLALRLRRHLDDSNPSRRRNWIKSLRTAGVRPHIELLEEYDDSESAFDAEREWISMARHLGCDLVNMTDGGEGVLNCSAETRAKMRAAKLGTKRSEEAKRKTSESLKRIGHRPAPGVRPTFGKEFSDKMRQIALTSPNHKVPKGWNKGMRGVVKMSEETKAKHRARAAKYKGVPRSEETKAKVSEGLRRAWARRKAAP